MLIWVLILAAGVAAGFINTVSGGGSLLTLPALILLGLPSPVANGTNRVALLVQNIVAVDGFKRRGHFYPKLGVIFGLPALVGAVIGAIVAVKMSDRLFQQLLAVIMLVVLALIFWRPEKRFLKETDDGKIGPARMITAVAAFFLVGLYGGVFQAGAGFVVMALLALTTGMSLVRINSVKALVIGIYILASLVIFVLKHEVNWLAGLVLSMGNGLGAYLGSTFVVKKGDRWIKALLVAMVLLMSAKLLGLLKLIGLP